MTFLAPRPALSRFRLPPRRIQNRPEMHQPPEQEEPQHGRETELEDRHQETPLEQLPETGEEEAPHGGIGVSGGASTRHDFPHVRAGSTRRADEHYGAAW